MANSKIHRVIVLGAGASCSYSESPTGMRPPLAKEIIQIYNNLSISENRHVLVGFLVNYVRNTRGVRPSEFASWDEDLETFFSKLDEEVASYSQKLMDRGSLTVEEKYHFLVSLKAYNQMIFLLASIFNEIQNGPVSKPYIEFANELKKDDAIITFNWDTLLDRALFTSGIWSPRNGYYIKPEAVYDDQWHDSDIMPIPVYSATDSGHIRPGNPV